MRSFKNDRSITSLMNSISVIALAAVFIFPQISKAEDNKRDSYGELLLEFGGRTFSGVGDAGLSAVRGSTDFIQRGFNLDRNAGFGSVGDASETIGARVIPGLTMMKVGEGINRGSRIPYMLTNLGIDLGKDADKPLNATTVGKISDKASLLLNENTRRFGTFRVTLTPTSPTLIQRWKGGIHIDTNLRLGGSNVLRAMDKVRDYMKKNPDVAVHSSTVKVRSALHAIGTNSLGRLFVIGGIVSLVDESGAIQAAWDLAEAEGDIQTADGASIDWPAILAESSLTKVGPASSVFEVADTESGNKIRLRAANLGSDGS